MAGRAHGGDLAVPVRAGPGNRPTLTRRVTTWQGHARVTEVRAMRQKSTFLQCRGMHIYAS